MADDDDHNHDHSHEHESADHDHSHDHAMPSYRTSSVSSTTREERLSKAHGFLDHKHNPQEQVVLSKLKRGATLCSIFLLVEVIGGYFSGSLAILSDAAHLCADLASFAVAIGAAYLAALPKTEYHTFGLQRVESLAALLSMLSLLIISIGLAIEAIRRLIDGDLEVHGPLMSGIAFIGVLVNIALAFVLGEHHVHLPGGGHDHDHDHGGHDDHDHHHDHHGTAKEDNHDHEHDHHDDDNHEHDHDHHDDDEEDHHDHDHDHDDDDHDHDHDHRDDEEDHQDHDHDHGHDDDDGHHDHDHAHEATPLLGPTASSNEKKKKKPMSMASFVPFMPENINLQAAYLHILGDLAQSFAVLLAGIIIWICPSWTIVDPLCTLLFCALVGYSTIAVLRTSVSVLLQEVPTSVDWTEIYDAIVALPGVSNVHDLHIWSISHGIPSLTVHCTAEDPERAMSQVYKVCRQYGIVHATIQVQSAKTAHGEECVTCIDRICRTCRESHHMATVGMEMV